MKYSRQVICVNMLKHFSERCINFNIAVYLHMQTILNSSSLIILKHSDKTCTTGYHSIRSEMYCIKRLAVDIFPFMLDE